MIHNEGYYYDNVYNGNRILLGVENGGFNRLKSGVLGQRTNGYTSTVMNNINFFLLFLFLKMM